MLEPTVKAHPYDQKPMTRRIDGILAWLQNPRSIALVVLAGFGIRVAVALYLGNNPHGLSGAGDEYTYHTLASRFSQGKGFSFPVHWYPWIRPDTPQSYFSLGMSTYLGVIYKLFGAKPLAGRLVGALLSSTSLFLVAAIARRIFDKSTAGTAVIMAAINPYLIFYGVTLTTEVGFTLGLLLMLFSALVLREEPSWRNWARFGLALVLATYFRSSSLAVGVAVVVWLVVSESRVRRSFWRISVPIFLVTLSLLPLTLRNYRLWDQFLLTESNFGHVVWNGNHPDQEGNFHPVRTFAIPVEVLELGNEAAMSKELLSLAMKNISDDPAVFLKLTVTRLREFFKFWPTADSSLLANVLRVASFGTLVPLVIVGIAQRRFSNARLTLLYVVVASHTFVHSVTWAMIRYRVPLDSLFIVIAASGLLWLLGVPRHPKLEVQSTALLP